MTRKPALSLLLLSLAAPVSAEIDQPGCDVLASWAAEYSPAKGESGPAAVPSVFRDEAFAGLFGKPLDRWQAQDFRSLDDYMKDCQRQLFKPNRRQAEQINEVRRQLPTVQRVVAQAREAAPQATAASTPSGGQRVLDSSTVVQAASTNDRPRAPTPRSAVTPGEFGLPACADLDRWAARLQRGETVQLTPKVAVDALLRATWTAPLFGLPAERWSRDDYGAAYRAMVDCRNAARAQGDTESFNRLHRAAKVVGKGGQAMRRVDRYRALAADNVDKILAHEASPALPQIVEVAQMALRGEDPAESIQAVRDQYPRLAYVIGDAKALADYTDYLTASDRDALIERLDAGKAKVVAQSRAIEQALAEARAAIAAAPATPEGMRRLQQLKEAPVLAGIGLQEVKAFRAEVQQRQNAIRAELRRQEAKRQARAEAEAKRPIDLEPRLTQLFRGDDLDDLRVGGLSVGMAERQAVATLKNQWQYQYEGGLSLYNDFVPTRPIYPQLEQERRDGGKLHLGVMDDDRVGQIRFVEHYKAMMATTQPQAWLQKTLGTPDEIGAARGGRLLTWKDGDLRLQVLATNRTDLLWRGAGYESELVISLWTEDYAAYLADLDARCQALLEEKRGSGSMSEAMWFAGHCDLAGTARDHVGI
jgi:hypothetical protein